MTVSYKIGVNFNGTNTTHNKKKTQDDFITIFYPTEAIINFID